MVSDSKLSGVADSRETANRASCAILGLFGGVVDRRCVHAGSMAVAAHLTVIPNPGFIDDNWHLDAAFKASRGIWIGRDVAFTHGPLFQWLSSVPGRSMGVSMGSIYPTWNTVPMWCAVLFAFFTLRLLLPEQPPWKRFLLLLLLCIFWGPSLRTSIRASRLRGLPARLVRGRRRPRQALCLRMRRSSNLRNRISAGCRPGDLRDSGTVGYAGCGRIRYPPQNARRQEIVARDACRLRPAQRCW